MWKWGLKLLQVAEKGHTGLYIMHLSQKDRAFFTPGRAEKSWMAAAVVERQGAYTHRSQQLCYRQGTGCWQDRTRGSHQQCMSRVDGCNWGPHQQSSQLL